MTAAMPSAPGHAATFLLRAAAYYLFWVVLAGTGLKDLAAGLVTALIAAWISLGLLPPGELRPRPVALLSLFLRFLWQSVVAGVTVASIALRPVMPLRPGIVENRTKLPPGNRRYLFMTYASLLPGTLPSGTDETDVIPVHALDCRQPVARQLAEEEARVSRAFAPGDGP